MDLAGGLRVDDLSKTDLFDFVCPDTPHQPFRLSLFTHQEELMEFSANSASVGSTTNGGKDMTSLSHGSSAGNTNFETVWLATPSPDEGYAGSTASGSAHAEEDMDVTAWTGSTTNNNCHNLLKPENSANGYPTSDADHNLNNAALTVALLSCDVNWATARLDNKLENESHNTADTATSSSPPTSAPTEPMDLDTLLQMVGFTSTASVSPAASSYPSQHPDSLFGESLPSYSSQTSINHDNNNETTEGLKKELVTASSHPQRLEPFSSIHPQARRMKSDYGQSYHSPPPPLVPLTGIGKNHWINPAPVASSTASSPASDVTPKMSLLRSALQGKPAQQLNGDGNHATTRQPPSKGHTELRKALSAPVGMVNPYILSRQLSTQPASGSLFTQTMTSSPSAVIDPGTPPLTPISSSALASPYMSGPSPESCMNSPTTPVSLSRQIGSNGLGSPTMTVCHDTPNGTPVPNLATDSSCSTRQFVLSFDNRSNGTMNGIKEEPQTLTELVSVDPMLSTGEVNMAAEFDFGSYSSESVIKLEPGTQRLLAEDVEVGGITNIDDLLMCDIDDIDKLKTYQKEVAESLNQMYHAASRHQLQQSVLEAVLASNSNSSNFVMATESLASDDASLPSSSSHVTTHQTSTTSTSNETGPKLNGAPVRKKRMSKKKKLLQEQELASSTASGNGSDGTPLGNEENLSTSPCQTSSSTDSLETKKERLLHYCSICSKGFKDKYSVNVHIRTHTGEKPFACPMCGKNFRQKAHLAKHQQTHSKIPGPSQTKSKR